MGLVFASLCRRRNLKVNMGILGWSTMLELTVTVAVICGLGLIVAIVIETFRRRLNHKYFLLKPKFYHDIDLSMSFFLMLIFF